jgi:tetratricopeptide (TPR) repeat protein
MVAGAAPGTRAAVEAADLHYLVTARPAEAMARARAILARGPGPAEASLAHQVIGHALRDFGDLDAAIAELRTALRLSRAAAVPGREAEVLATLGNALIHRGQSKRGLAALNAALALVTGPAAGRMLMMRGIDLWILGRHQEALDDLGRALRILRPAADPIWEARALSARALVHLACGSARRAGQDLDRAERLFATTSQDVEIAYTWHNRGLVAFRSGDVPLALSYLDQAQRRYQALGVRVPDLAIDRCAVLLAAGLARDALQEADTAVRAVELTGGQPTKKAELLLTAARAALAAGQPPAALARAQAARRMFAAQGRAWWHAHAVLLHLQARLATGAPTAALLRQAGQVAADLAALGSPDAPQARLLAGRAALALRQTADAERHLTAAARARSRGPAFARINGWLAEALRAEAADDPRRLLHACRRGLAVLDQYGLTLGASELRAQATVQGAELAALAQRHALRAGRPRRLLEWSERWRSTALAVPPVRPPDDRALQADLTAVREIASRLEQARGSGTPAAALEREQRRLEALIRDRVRQARGGEAGRPGGARPGGARPGAGHPPGAGHRLDTGALLGALGEARLVQIADIEGELHVLVCGAGQVRQVAAGRAEDAAREVAFARFGLSRLAHGRAAGGPDRALTVLEATGRRLEAVLLGRARRHLGDGPVIVVPPGRLHAVPWSLLPALRGRPVSVSPSARAWLRARQAPPPAGTRVVLVRGPGLGTGELDTLASEYGLTLLAGVEATAARVLAAIDGARLAHLAAHGTFRADSPLFSALRMHDGPLTGYDFERLHRAPYHLILPACDSGLLAPAGADELLGLISSLLPLGTAGLVASVVPVNDAAAGRLMLALHRQLHAGAGLAAALRDACGAVGPDPVQTATAWSFVSYGAG